MDSQKTLCWDFDGVIHPYTAGWCGSTPADEPPVPGVVDLIKEFHAAGFRQVVQSSRADHADGHHGIVNYLLHHDLTRYIAVVTDKKPIACCYIDDRGIAFTGDIDAVRAGVERLAGAYVHGGGNPQ